MATPPSQVVLIIFTSQTKREDLLQNSTNIIDYQSNHNHERKSVQLSLWINKCKYILFICLLFQVSFKVFFFFTTNKVSCFRTIQKIPPKQRLGWHLAECRGFFSSEYRSGVAFKSNQAFLKVNQPAEPSESKGRKTFFRQLFFNNFFYISTPLTRPLKRPVFLFFFFFKKRFLNCQNKKNCPAKVTPRIAAGYGHWAAVPLLHRQKILSPWSVKKSL